MPAEARHRLLSFPYLTQDSEGGPGFSQGVTERQLDSPSTAWAPWRSVCFTQQGSGEGKMYSYLGSTKAWLQISLGSYNSFPDSSEKLKEPKL